MTNHWETLGKRVITSEKRGVLKVLLLLASYLYRFALFCREKLFDYGIFSAKRVEGSLIVSVGNITAGGTGKSPFVKWVAKELAPRPVAVLSRGYRTADEAKMLSRCPGVSVYVGANRYKSALQAMEDGHSLILLDDGFQHRMLERDLDVVVVNGRDPFGRGYFLPRGFLRDTPKSLKRSDLVVIHRPGKNLADLKKRIALYCQAPCIVTDVKVVGLHPAVDIRGKKVALFSAIGDHLSFEETVASLGASIVDHLTFPDHYPAQGDRLKRFTQECKEKGATHLLCTEKDWVKLYPEDFSLPLSWVEIEMAIVEGRQEFEKFIKKLEVMYETVG